MAAMKKAMTKAAAAPAMKTAAMKAKAMKAMKAMKKAMMRAEAIKVKSTPTIVKENRWLKGQLAKIVAQLKKGRSRKWQLMENENLFLHAKLSDIHKIASHLD